MLAGERGSYRREIKISLQKHSLAALSKIEYTRRYHADGI